MARLIAAGMFMCACLAPVHAQNLDSRLSMLIGSGRVDEAKRLLDATNPDTNDKAFFVGRVLKARRQFVRAAAVFRAILLRDPGYINARRELAHTLLLAGDFEGAEFRFRQLLATDPSPRMQPVYRRYLAVIAQSKPVGISGSVSLVPSSNVNRGSALSEFDDGFGTAKISEDSKAKSGVGLQAGLSGYLRRIPDRQSRLSLNWSLLGVKYKDSDFDRALARISVSYERLGAWGNWSVEPYLRNEWASRDETSGAGVVSVFGSKTRAAGLRLGLQRRTSPRDIVSLSFTGESRRYPTADYQNGPVYNLSAALRRRVRPDLTLDFGVSLDRSLPKPAHLKYDGVKLSASVAKIWASGLQTSIGIDVGGREFQGNYVFRDAPRSDHFWGISVSLFNPKLTVRGLAPRLSCSYTRNRSNIEFFVYDVQECQISLTRNF